MTRRSGPAPAKLPRTTHANQEGPPAPPQAGSAPHSGTESGVFGRREQRRRPGSPACFAATAVQSASSGTRSTRDSAAADVPPRPEPLMPGKPACPRCLSSTVGPVVLAGSPAEPTSIGPGRRPAPVREEPRSLDSTVVGPVGVAFRVGYYVCRFGGEGPGGRAW